ncbi:MAG: hypothetical protein JW832_00980 [Deltaproteobacteria bacterium]|nr:hypothetical protein [Deltaproteobacteria bacterium]
MNLYLHAFTPLCRLPFRVRDILALSMLALYWAAFVTASPASMQKSLVDDAYIFQRVVDNFWDGHGLTYNYDAMVNPITSPFYAFILAGAKVFPCAAPATISFVYLSGLIALGAGIYFGIRQYNRLLALTMAIFVSSASVPIRSWGMETSTFMACIVFSILAYTHGRYLTAGMFCAFTALSRPEGIALIGVLAGAHLLTERKLLWGMLTVFAATLTPWLLYSWATYGHIVPSSVSVKAIQHTIGWWRKQPSWLNFFLNQPLIPWVSYPLAALGVFQAYRDFMNGHRFLLLIMAFGAIQVAAYSLLDAPVGYFWYLAPGNMALDIAIVLGAFTLGQSIFGLFEANKALHVSAVIRAAFISVMVLVYMTKFAAAPFSRLKPYRLGSEYRAAGEWIEQNTPGDFVVAATEIGYIGYFSKRRIRDIHGLLHPEALPSLQKEEWDWWFKSNPPQVIVMHSPPWKGEPSGLPDWQSHSLQQFRDQYRRIISFRQVAVYQRQSTISD